MSLSQHPTGLSIDCSGLPVETVEAMQSVITLYHDQTEQSDQGPRAFARLVTAA